MKMRKKHYDQLKNEIECLPRDKVLAHRQELTKDTRVFDFQKRFRWDLLHATKQSKWVCDVLYAYLNDTHIDTALRKIVEELDLAPACDCGVKLASDCFEANCTKFLDLY